MNSIPINVSAAVIIKGNKVLLAKRKKGYLLEMWEFPGGKIESGETVQAAAVREINEELNLEIEAGDILLVLEHEYPDKCVRLHFVKSKLSVQKNNTNIDFESNPDVGWFSIDDFPFGQFCPADSIAASNIQWHNIIEMRNGND